MPRFNVTIEEVLRHTITVDVADEEIAGFTAIEILLASGSQEFNTDVTARTVFTCLPAIGK